MRVTGGRVFDPERGFLKRDVCTDGSCIGTESGDDRVLDAAGCYVIPGLIDIHLHGCGGGDFSDGRPDSLEIMARYALKRGVTAICPTAMTLPEAALEKICRTAADFCPESRAEILGVHLEGPFLSPEKRGAQEEKFLRLPDADMLFRLQKAARGRIRRLTLAPELPGAPELICAAAEQGIAVSLGHTAGDYATARAAFAAGATQVTHLYNGMGPMHHREPGVIGAALDTPGVWAELICDGFHVHESVVRAAFRLFGSARMVMVSDSLSAAGMPDGRYWLGGQPVEVRGGQACLACQPGTLAGSVTDLMECLRRAAGFGVPLEDVVRACTMNPARAMGESHRIGGLELGMQADIVLLDEGDLSLRAVIARGVLQE